MTYPLHIYIGFDPINALAYRALEASILDQTDHPVEIHPIRDWEMRKLGYTRSWLMAPDGQKVDIKDDRPHSTEFSYTRYLTPWLHLNAGRSGPALFMDSDMMLRGDIAKIYDYHKTEHEVSVVKHHYRPEEKTKITGVVQQQYKHKNWSSFMLFSNPAASSFPPQALDLDAVNNKKRSWMEQFKWASNVGSLPTEWNWLEGWSSEELDPLVVHFTRGTPDLPGWGNVAYADEWWMWAKMSGYRGHNSI